jgi:hypothetical protein
MKTESRLNSLQSRYRAALGPTLAAKARYLAIKDEQSVTEATVRRAATRWAELEERKRALSERIRQVEQSAENPRH